MKAKRFVNLLVLTALLTVGNNMESDANTVSKNQEAVFAAG